MSNIELNLNNLVQTSGISANTLNSQEVIANIDSLAENYSSSDLVKIYNYFLVNSEEPDVIMHLIRNLDMYRDSSSLEYLVEVLLLKNAKYSDPTTR